MNNHHTTEDPKNIRMTEQERSTLHASIMKQVGMPNIQRSPIKIHPSYWLSSSVFKPVFLALFLLMISTSGILLYQERAIKETKEETTPIENKPEEQMPIEPSDTIVEPVNTTPKRPSVQSSQTEATTAPMLMNASSVEITQPVVSQKRVADTRQTGIISGRVRKINPVCMMTDRSTPDPACQNTTVHLNLVATNKDTGEQYTLYATDQGEIQDALPLGTYLVEPENKEEGILKPNEYIVSENSPYQVFTLYK